MGEANLIREASCRVSSFCTLSVVASAKSYRRVYRFSRRSFRRLTLRRESRRAPASLLLFYIIFISFFDSLCLSFSLHLYTRYTLVPPWLIDLRSILRSPPERGSSWAPSWSWYTLHDCKTASNCVQPDTATSFCGSSLIGILIKLMRWPNLAAALLYMCTLWIAICLNVSVPNNQTIQTARAY